MYGPSPGASRRLGSRLTLILAFLVAVASAVVPTARGTTTPTTADPLFGINMSFFGADDAFVTQAATRELFRSWGVPIVRVPLRDRFKPDGPPVTDDQWMSAMRAVRDIGATPMLIIRAPGSGRTADDVKKTDLHLLDLIHQVFGDGTAYLEFGNEPDGPDAGVPVADYTAAWNTVVPALKSRYPKAAYRYVGPASWRVDHDYVKYIGAFVAGATPEPDYLSWHEYVCDTVGDSDWKQTCETHLANWQTHVTDVEMTVQGKIGRQLPYFISEWNADSGDKGSVYTEANAGYLASWTTKAIERLRGLRPAPAGAMVYTATDHEQFGLVTGADRLTTQGRAFRQAMTGSSTVTRPKAEPPSEPASPVPPPTTPASGTRSGTDAPPEDGSQVDSPPTPTGSPSPTGGSSPEEGSSHVDSPPATPSSESPSPAENPPSGGPGASQDTGNQDTGNQYYVASDGDDAKGDGTSAHPWATIQHAADQATVGNAGATVHVADGTYAESISTTKGGHEGAYLTFEAEHPGKAVIAPKTSAFPFESKGDYVRVIGFDISGTGGAWSGILIWGHHNVIQGNHVHDVLTHLASSDCDGSPGGQAIGDDAAASDNAFIGNRVDHIGPYPTACEYVHGIYPSGGADVIANNIVSQTSGSGIRFNHNAKGATIANNLSFANANHGIYITGGDSTADGFVITNNIVRDNAMYGINVRGDANGPHNEYRNNLFFDNHKGRYGLDNSEEFTPPNSSGTLDADPRLVRYAADGTGDYHLTADSPCVDAGTTTGAPAGDLDGGRRPAGKGIDIGPYELAR
ncbi:right-handed parallel beta-helix repeat-containing protein [Actinoallomurus spadix]|uniref:Right handed beta helix domain-containing protein n=1 Tax=Actinoallomurus spadix TaxID=79912 RepID=A0ABN0W0Z8_9ACTN|nr:choice-of-anchor Q domain-containing protein [Actinoallomurus spadix]MCO5985324.1 right-handed parallel beta-helix repeat-containing protein [Actinoallomurus spadix]